MNAKAKNMTGRMLSNRQTTGKMKLAGMALAVLLLVFSVLGCMTMEMSGSGSQSKGAMSAVSEAGLFRTSIESEVDPIPVNAIHAWKLHVEGSDGQPVIDAVITIDGGMPAHGHGLPTQPQITQNLGNGDYLVEGMKFHMQGQWVVTFQITAGDREDTVTFEFGL
jgi:hypothetical protein